MSSKLIFPYEIWKVFSMDLGDFYIISIPVRFQRTDGTWLKDTTKMLNDTGANISLLPMYMFEDLQIDKYVEQSMTGVVKSKECKLPLRICRVKCRLEDDFGNKSPEFSFWIAIAERNDVPSLLGMKDIIKLFKVKMDPDKEELCLYYNKE